MRGTAIAATRPPFSMESRTDAAGFPSRAAPIDLVVGHSNDRPRVQQRDSDSYSNPAAKMCTQSLLRVGYRKGSFQPELGIIYPAAACMRRSAYRVLILHTAHSIESAAPTNDEGVYGR